MRRWLIAMVSASLLAVPCVQAAEPETADAETSGAEGAAARAKPYLTPETDPDELAGLPAPPEPGTPAAKADADLYVATRALAGTPRWALAIGDADRAPAAIWRDFGCALGADIPPDRVPRVVALLGRLNADVEQATRAVKSHYRRARPLVGNDAPICVKRSERFMASFSYPSGHATQGWATAILLAQLAPDRAAVLMRRGFTFGESRIVCGAHWGSDVEAGRIVATTLVAVLNADADFLADLADARRELVARRADNPPVPDPSACRVQTEANDRPLP